MSYLSVVGSPPFSRCLCAWDARDFQKIPTSFAIKDKAATEVLAYHPFLPWVACKGRSGEPLLFDRESGAPVPDRTAALDLGSAKVHDLWFSADGKGVVLDTSVNEIHYLQRVALTLSADETRACEAAYEELAGAPLARTSLPSVKSQAVKIPLSELHALQGGSGRAMTAKDVAKWFTDAVVVVKTPDASGTGMLVGADGYILTCAHCVTGAERIEVSYRRPIQGQIRSVTTKATLLKADEARDLALLKIRVPFPLRTVRFGSSADLVSGERVYVIGNPGVSTTILDYTITDGIVSSPSRKLGDYSYVQTSAAVNPGSSGGPLFNERGLVVGQVVLKATIEGAGFATPSDQIMRFLVGSVDLSEGLELRRDWIDSTGAYRVSATLEEIDGDRIKLRKPDGAELAVPLDRLSKPDRTFVDLLRRRLSR